MLPDTHTPLIIAAVYFGCVHDVIAPGPRALMILQIFIPPELSWYMSRYSPTEGESLAALRIAVIVLSSLFVSNSSLTLSRL